MTGAPLIMTPEVVAVLHDLRERAVLAPVDMRSLADKVSTPEGKAAHTAHMTEQTVVIPGPWLFGVTYSVETGHPCGPCRHMSMSIRRQGRVVHPLAIEMVAAELGFTGGIKDWATWPEELAGHGPAVNVVQPIAAGVSGARH